MVRLLIVAVAFVSALAFASGTFAQTAPQSSQAAPPSGGTGGRLRDRAAGAPGLVYRTQCLQALPGQRCTCERPACLPWLPYGVPIALLGLRSSSGSLAMFAAMR
jgi:hypothetical protein